MDGLGPRLWTLWIGLKIPNARRSDWAWVRVVGRTTILFLLKIYLFNYIK